MKTKKQQAAELAAIYKYRDDERLAIEKKLGIKFQHPIFSIHGLTFSADGYEAPYIRCELTLPEREDHIILNEHHVRSLLNETRRMLEWCEKGWCPGAC